MIDEQEVLIGRIVLRQRFGAAHAQYFDGYASRDADAVTADIAKRGGEADYDRIAASRCKHSLAQVVGQIVINSQFAFQESLAFGMLLADGVVARGETGCVRSFD